MEWEGRGEAASETHEDEEVVDCREHVGSAELEIDHYELEIDH